MDIISASASASVEYTLTKQHNIMQQTYTEVFSALQIGLPLSSQATENTRVPDLIVVKVLKLGKNYVDRVADMWLREIRAHRGLVHPSIVRLYDSDARFFSLYMEHVVAQDLARNRSMDFFFAGPDEPDVIIRLVRNCTSAIGYIHTQGLHHNDIKPANILFDLHRGAMICDFGHARAADMAWVLGGTPAYLAPELINPISRHASSKWDSWALGVTLLYVLRKLRLPEKCAHWVISTMVRWKGQPEGIAEDEMRRWLVQVMKARDELRQTDDPELRAVHSCVLGLLEEDPSQRLDMRSALGTVQVSAWEATHEIAASEAH